MKKNMKISTKFYLTFTIIGIAVLLFIFVSRIQSQKVYEKYENVISTYDAVGADLAKVDALYLKIEVLSCNLVNRDKVTSEEYESTMKEIAEISEEVEKQMEYVDKMITSGDLKEQLNDLERLIEKETETGNTMMGLVKEGKGEEAQAICDSDFIVLADEIDEAIEKIEEDCLELAHQDATDAYNARISNEIISTIFIIIGLLFLIVVSTVSVRDIRIPMANIVEAVKKLSKGDVNVSIQKRKCDEFGVLTDAINELAAKEQRAADIAKKVSAGDLSMFVNPESAEDVLGNAIKLLVDENNSTLTNIREASIQVGTGSKQVAMASQSLAQGSTQQASALEQVTASISDITEKTKTNADDATRARTLVRETKSNAEAGNLEMTQMVDAMKDINEASENISKIIKTIDDIAFQTNILALNAAVEAARAGEHGKGFAVVAEEVRSLAAKSAEAASETADMIEDSIQKVQNGSELAIKTAGMLSEIVSAVDTIVTLIEEIANASNDQASALTQIDQAVNQVSQVVQTNSATSEQCAAASEELSNQAKNLEHLVSRYHLRAMTDNSSLSFLENTSTDSFGVSSDYGSQATSNNSTYGSNVFIGSSVIPDASDFAGMTNEVQNEQIISLEDNMYSKY